MPGHIIVCLPSRKLKTQHHKNVLQAACTTGPVLEPGYRPWIPRPTLTHFNPSHYNQVHLYPVPLSWVSLNLIPGHNQCSIFFFLSPGRHHGKSLLVIMTGRLFSFCKNKRSRRDLSLHPEQVLVRKEVGHNEDKEFLSFSTRAGKAAAEDEAVHVAGWSLLDWDFSSWIEAKGKEKREGERERQSKRYHCAVGGTSLKGID